MDREGYEKLKRDLVRNVVQVTLHCSTGEERNIASQVFRENGYAVENLGSKIDPKRFALRITRRLSS